MTRGNQREKAREKNLKDQAGAVGLTITQDLEQKDRYHAFEISPCTVTLVFDND